MDGPRLLTGLLLLVGCARPVAQAPTPTSTSAPDSAIEAVLEAWVAKGFAGAIVVADNDTVLAQRVRGPRMQRQPDVGPLTLDAPVRLASITKQITSVMVLQAVAAGRLALDDTLGARWPEFPNEATRKVTIRQLLMHQSGVPNPDTTEGFYTPGNPASARMDAAAVGVCAGPLQFEPGSNFQYNNCDYLILGALLERLEGKPWASLVQTRVLEPAGMTSTRVAQAADDAGDQVQGSMASAEGPREFDDAVNPAAYGAAGGLVGSVMDVVAFDRALVGGRLLGAAGLAAMTAPNDWGGALGVWSYDVDVDGTKVQVIERQGWIGGVRWLNLIVPTRGRYVVVMTTQAELDLSSTAAGQGLGAELVRAVLANDARPAASR